MKKDELIAAGLTDEQADKIFAMNGRDIEKHKEAARKAQEKLTELQSDLTEKENVIRDLKEADADGLKEKLVSLQKEYETERQEWKQKEEQRTYEQRRDSFFADVKFADPFAQKGVLAEFDSKKFQYSENEKEFSGAGEWLKNLMDSSPTTFAGDRKPPQVVRPTGNGNIAETPTKESFGKMTYRERAALKHENPELYQELKE